MTHPTTPRTFQDTWPPPSVVGDSRWPYPVTGERGGVSIERACAHARERRAQSGLATVPPGEVLSVRPPWSDVPLFTRSGDRPWVLHPPGVARVADVATRIGLWDRIPRVVTWRENASLTDALTDALARYLDAVAWWTPDTVPAASGALEAIFDQLLRTGQWTWDDTFPAEHDAADAGRTWRSHGEEYTPWDSRMGRLEIEEMIVASGRTAPFRLRPLILITENSAKRQWWYGGWGVHDADDHGHAGALLAVHGKHARIPDLQTWMAPRDYDGPMPSSDEIRWYGYRFDDDYSQHADIRCALTGVSLYDGTRGVIANAPCPADALVPDIPRTLSTLRRAGDRLERVAESTGLPGQALGHQGAQTSPMLVRSS
jgi:hypothetical protein